MKKIIAWFCVLIAISPFFYRCSKKDEAAGQPAKQDEVIELDMYFPMSVGSGPDTVISRLCEQFHAENPSVRINPVYAGSYAETRTMVQAAIRSGSIPAVALMFSVDLFSLLSMDVLYDYDSFCVTEEDKAWLTGFYPAFMKNSSFGGKTYGIPWQRSTIILYYNKDAFFRAGLDPEKPPATWDELRAMAKWLTVIENNVTVQYGIQIPSDKAGYAYWMFQSFCTQQGGFNLMNEDGTEVYFSDPRAVRSLAFWKSLSDDGSQAPGISAWSSTPNDFLQQKTAMIYFTSGNLANIRKNAEFNFGAAMLPAGISRGSPTGGGNFYLFKGVPKEQTRAAFTFIKWMTCDPDRAAQWSIETGYIAVRPDAYETPRFKEYARQFPLALVARDQLQYARAEFSVYDQRRIQDILDTAVESVMTGQQSPEDALQAAQSEADAILGRYRN